MNAVIYARYSSDNQREESIDGQIRECTDYARRENIKIVGTYIDRALSARTADRPDFQRMIHDSEKRLFDAVIVWKLDRFSRDRYDSAFYKRQLRKNGVKLISATEAISDGPEGIILEALLEGMNEYYSAELSVKIKRGHKENALKCMSNGGQLAYGYRVNPETRLFEPDPVTAPIVKEIFARYANGDQMKNIVSDLNARGLKPYYSDQFYVSTLGVMLKNRKYIGEYRYGEVVIPDGVPAIIDEDIFEKVQRRLAMNKKAPAKGKAIEEYLLSTKLYCGVCGGLMVGESGRSRNSTVHFYYKCGNAKRHKGCKRRKAIRKHGIEKLVVIFTVNNVLQDDVIDRIADAMTAMQYQEDATVPALKAQLKECEKGITNLVNAIQAGILTASTKERLEQLEKEREALTINIAQAQLARPKYTKEQIVDWISQFKYGNINDPDYQKQIIETFVNSVYLYEDHLILNYNYKNGTETFSLDEVNEAFGSDLKNFAPPKSASERVRIFLCISMVSGFRRVVSILRIFAFYPHLTHNRRVKHGRFQTQKTGYDDGGLFPSAVRAEALDVVFHALCALPLHADGGVGVGSEREACGGVTQIFLHRFDVVPGFQAVDREGVAQIVEFHVLQADLFHDRLVVTVHRLIRHETPELVGEHQIVRVLESRTQRSRLLFLPCFLFPEHVHDVLRHRQHPHALVFQGAEMVFLLALGTVVLLVDQKRAALEVHAVPCQPEHLALPHPGEDRHEEDSLVGMSLDGVEERNHIAVLHRMNLCFLHAREDDGVERVCFEIPQLDRL